MCCRDKYDRWRCNDESVASSLWTSERNLLPDIFLALDERMGHWKSRMITTPLLACFSLTLFFLSGPQSFSFIIFFFLLTKRRHFVGQLPSSLFFLFFFFSFFLENLFSNCLTLYYFSFSLSPVLLALGAIFDHRCSLVWTLRVGAIRRYYANVICWLGSRYGYAIDFQEFDWQQCNGGERERETRAMSELAELTTPRRGDAAEIIPDPISLQNHRP